MRAYRLVSYGRDGAVGFRPAVAVELPGVAHLLDELEIEVGDDQLVAIAAADRDDLPAGIAEVALAVELADVPGRFVADAIDRADEVPVGNGVRRLLQLPEILGQPGDGRGRVQHDLRAVQPEDARPFGEMPVVADVDADLPRGGVEHRVAQVPGAEVELLPEARRHVR